MITAERTLPDMFNPALLRAELDANGVGAGSISWRPANGYTDRAAWVQFDADDEALAVMVVEAHDPDYAGSVRVWDEVVSRARADAKAIMQTPGFQTIKAMSYTEVAAWLAGLSAANQIQAIGYLMALVRDKMVVDGDAPNLFDW